MTSKTQERNKIRVVTLGCSKNTVDSEVLVSQLKAGGLDAFHEQESGRSGVVVVNTCGFIDNARQESIDAILHFAKEKQEGRINALYVTGCLSERYRPDLEKEIPEVDAYFGTHDLPALLEKLGSSYRHELIGERSASTPVHYAYLKISEGCDRPCSFCAIPVMRGRHVSRPIEKLVEEARFLAASGTRELILIAQDSTYYGLDIYKKRRLDALLDALAGVRGIDWIRLHYAYPAGFPVNVLEVMRRHENICSYIDMPLQHISGRILKSMRRGASREETLKLIDRMRERLPGVALRTTFICGYPGETDAEHEELLEFVRQVRFERLGVFTYSHEEDTQAHALPDDVPQEVKQARADSIMQVQQDISRSLNEKRTGTVVRVLFDRKEGGYFVGRTEWDSPEVDNEVLVDASANYVRTGDFAEVHIDSAGDFELFGTVV